MLALLCTVQLRLECQISTFITRAETVRTYAAAIFTHVAAPGMVTVLKSSSPAVVFYAGGVIPYTALISLLMTFSPKRDVNALELIVWINTARRDEHRFEEAGARAERGLSPIIAM